MNPTENTQPDKYAINLEIGEALQQEVANAFQQSAMFKDWFRVINDEWWNYSLLIILSDGGAYLIDKQNTESSPRYYSLFVDAYREGLKLYVERVNEAKADE